ncbi:MAG: hypothetical protein RJP95_00170 [Pirellulales bacterium]
MRPMVPWQRTLEDRILDTIDRLELNSRRESAQLDVRGHSPQPTQQARNYLCPLQAL